MAHGSLHLATAPHAFPADRLVFSACRADEVAYESNGHGHFTLKATALLPDGAGQRTNRQFQNDLVAAFGSGAVQHPVLDCADAREDLRLLTGTSDTTSDGRGVSDVATFRDSSAVLALLQAATQLLKNQS